MFSEVRITLPKIRQKTLIQYLLIYLLIGFSGSLFFNNYFNVLVVVTMIILFLLMIMRQVIYKKKFVNFFLIFTGMLLFVSVYTVGSLSLLTILNYATRILVVYNAIAICKDEFARRFVKVSLILAIISLIGFVTIEILNIHIFDGLFVSGVDQKNYYHYSPFFAYNTYVHLGRNIGIYNEPGMYQILISVAIIMILYTPVQLSIKEKKKYLTIFIVTMLSIQSTTGFVNLSIILFTYLLGGSKMKDNKIGRYFIFGLMVGGLIFLLLGGGDLINKVILQKIFINGKFDLGASTGLARITSISADIKMALEHPLGMGYERYQIMWPNYLNTVIVDTYSTSGLTTQLATIGILPTLCLFSNIVNGLNRVVNNTLGTIGIVSVYLFSVLSEPTFSFTLFLVFGFLRYFEYKKEIER